MTCLHRSPQFWVFGANQIGDSQYPFFRIGAFFLFLMLSVCVRAEEQMLTSVDALLERAAKALQETNYQGRFTYEFGSTLETLEIVHVVKDGVEYERITHLNGPEREFLRNGRRHDCISAGGTLLRGGLVPQSGGSVSLAQNYHFYIRGRDRIAGREVEVVQVVPKDEFRYGVTLALDKASGLPLMSLTTVSNKNAIERFQFIELQVGGAISELDLTPVAQYHAVLDGSRVPCNSVPGVPSIWRAGWLPPGFVLTQTGTNEHGDALTYTDGIASFTVFIEPLQNLTAFKQGLARRGATVAFMTALPLMGDPIGVVLVGEVPVATAQQVVASISPSPGGN
jgi:sigma-E factor negative regulatory protein RseB